MRPITVYLEDRLHRALKVKAATNDQSISHLVNEAVRESLREDEIDLAIARRRLREPSIPFERVVADLKRKGRL
ncbi:MAG: CopG family transcriptional regulator [Acidobacteria bacterium]|nr:CopG family transcriptional regulator [Acidobacteriota bacterium]